MPASSTHGRGSRASSALKDRMVAATAAIRGALADLAPNAQTSVPDIANAFAAIHKVLELRHCDQSHLAGSLDGDFTRVLADYRSALKEFHQQLPRVHGWLLAEKARLECRRSHADSVQTWLETTKQTR